MQAPRRRIAARRRWTPGACLPALTLMLLAAAGPVRAQGGGAERTWELDSLRSGFCVHFLIEPATAISLFPGAQVRAARGGESLHPALRRLLQETPDLGSWIPSRFCIYHFGVTSAGGRSFSDRKHAQPQTVAFWTVQAPEGVAPAVRVLSSNSGLGGSLRSLGVSVPGLSSRVGKVPQSTDDRYEVKYDGALLTWDGHATGDSAAATPLDATWTVTGRAGKPIRVHMTVPGLGSRLMVGALRVEGKGELARTLRDSPIRIVGPLVWGGSGTVEFGP